jgi:hypothetical protein
MNRQLSWLFRLIPCLTGLWLTQCYSTDNAPQPPDQQLYFPTGLAISPAGQALYIANSNFDLQYTAGTVQVLDLERIRKLIPPVWDDLAAVDGQSRTIDCTKYGLGSLTTVSSILYPAPCSPIDLLNPPDGGGTLIKQNVKIGAFASDVKLALRPAETGKPGARLLIPVRGDPSLTWFDVDDDRYETQSFRLDCGQDSSGNRCSDSHRAGIDISENSRALTIPAEPFQMAISEGSEAMVITHQNTGATSLFLNGWGDLSSAQICGSAKSKPTLEFVLGGLPAGAAGITALPTPLYVKKHPELSYNPGFLVSFRAAAALDVVRYVNDCNAAPSRPFLSRVDSVGINANAGGFDSRGVTVDPRPRNECEQACTEGSAEYDNCLIGCAALPIDVYVVNRAPPSLLLGETLANASSVPPNDSVRLYDQIPLAQGPSRVKLGTIIDKNGRKQRRVFVICFDSRLIYVYDPETRQIETTIKTGRGPAAIEFDPGIGNDSGGANFAYLAHFTDSYLGVIDLDMRHTQTYLTMVASLGIPVPPRDSKLPHGDVFFCA